MGAPPSPLVLASLTALRRARAQWGKLRRYWAVVAVFLLNIYTNIMALKASNVETVIVFRSVTTVVVAFGDAAALRSTRGLPSAPVVACLLAIVLFAAAFVAAERAEGMQVARLSGRAPSPSPASSPCSTLWVADRAHEFSLSIKNAG